MKYIRRKTTPRGKAIVFLILLPSAFCLLPFTSTRVAHAADGIVSMVPSSYRNGLSSLITRDSVADSGGKELVVLVHGFFRTPRDMAFLGKYLQSCGYEVFAPTLPTTFGSLEECTMKLEQELSGIQTKYTRIHFIGHSMGGLIVRQFLSKKRIDNIGRCVLITTPNRGSELVSAIAWFKPLMVLLRPLQAFRPGGVSIRSPANNPPPEMGAIAGTGDGLFLGRFMKGKNDGRIPVDSVPFPEMKDFLVLPYNHHDIHHREVTARYIVIFLNEGTFGIDKEKPPSYEKKTCSILIIRYNKN